MAEYTSSQPFSSMVKVKRVRKSPPVSMAAGQNCIAAAMAKVITKMVNSNIQDHCMSILQVDDLDNVEVRIRQILQQIDVELMAEKERVKQYKANKK